MKYNAIIIGLAVALLVSGTEPATAEKPPKHCDFAKARPANPYGSILLPASAAPSPLPPDDDISATGSRKKKSHKTGANEARFIHFKSC